ncbi:MAG: AprI/Inh family metalloprotease inhibitor [Hyphomicrobiales bacterium]
MKKIHSQSTLIAISIGVAACAPQQRLQQPITPTALTPAPVAPVASNPLPTANTTVPTAPRGYTPPKIETASAGGDLQAIPQLPKQTNTGVSLSDNITVGPDIDFGRNAVLGAWNVSAKADTCALNLSLTTWTAGFRASTRKCSDSTLVSIGSWKLTGKQLTLSNAQGATIARLIASGPNRFDGSTESGGKAISVFR